MSSSSPLLWHYAYHNTAGGWVHMLSPRLLPLFVLSGLRLSPRVLGLVVCGWLVRSAALSELPQGNGMAQSSHHLLYCCCLCWYLYNCCCRRPDYPAAFSVGRPERHRCAVRPGHVKDHCHQGQHSDQPRRRHEGPHHCAAAVPEQQRVHFGTGRVQLGLWGRGGGGLGPTCRPSGRV